VSSRPTLASTRVHAGCRGSGLPAVQSLPSCAHAFASLLNRPPSACVLRSFGASGVRFGGEGFVEVLAATQTPTDKEWFQVGPSWGPAVLAALPRWARPLQQRCGKKRGEEHRGRVPLRLEVGGLPDDLAAPSRAPPARVSRRAPLTLCASTLGCSGTSRTATWRTL
jgi:hypothetical protein